MKSILLAIALALTLSQPALARSSRGNEGANGGDEVALEFRLAFSSGIKRIKRKLPALYRKIQHANLAKILENTHVLVVQETLSVKRNDVWQESIAINTLEPRQIVVNRTRWNEILKIEIKEALALHEVASLAGLESTGKYPLSGEYLSLFSLGSDPEFDFTPVCGRLDSMLHRREVDRFQVGEGTSIDVAVAAVAMQRALSACGSISYGQYCESILPKLELILWGFTEMQKIGEKSANDVEFAAYDLAATKKYCKVN